MDGAIIYFKESICESPDSDTGFVAGTIRVAVHHGPLLWRLSLPHSVPGLRRRPFRSQDAAEFRRRLFRVRNAQLAVWRDLGAFQGLGQWIHEKEQD